jgi:hypothetical protein
MKRDVNLYISAEKILPTVLEKDVHETVLFCIQVVPVPRTLKRFAVLTEIYRSIRLSLDE